MVLTECQEVKMYYCNQYNMLQCLIPSLIMTDWIQFFILSS